MPASRATGAIMEISKDLMAASSTPIVLAIVAEADSYGYAILQRVRELSGGHIEWTDEMLYPVLHRLERLGQVELTLWRTRSRRPRPGAGSDSVRRRCTVR
jgi:DNA-binding PadR family transcriptional regulator